MVYFYNKRLLNSVLPTLLLVALTILFVYAEVTKNIILGDTILPLILPVILILYLTKEHKRNFYFLMFVVLYSLSQLPYEWTNLNAELIYFVGVSFCVLAYSFLLIDAFERLRRRFGLKYVVTKYRVHLLALLVLNVFLYTILSSHFHMFHHMTEILVVSNLYSVMTLMLFSLATINLFINRNRKALWFFFAALCVVVADVVQITYYSNTSLSTLGVVYSLLQVLPFYLFYKQAIVD